MISLKLNRHFFFYLILISFKSHGFFINKTIKEKQNKIKPKAKKK